MVIDSLIVLNGNEAAADQCLDCRPRSGLTSGHGAKRRNYLLLPVTAPSLSANSILVPWRLGDTVLRSWTLSDLGSPMKSICQYAEKIAVDRFHRENSSYFFLKAL